MIDNDASVSMHSGIAGAKAGLLEATEGTLAKSISKKLAALGSGMPGLGKYHPRLCHLQLLEYTVFIMAPVSSLGALVSKHESRTLGAQHVVACPCSL